LLTLLLRLVTLDVAKRALLGEIPMLFKTLFLFGGKVLFPRYPSAALREKKILFG
jgi:hypothetical protein